MQIETCFSLPGARQAEEEGGPDGWTQEPEQLEEGQHPPSHSVSVILTPWGSTQPPPPPQHQNVMSPSLERGPQPCACPWGPLGVAHAEPGEAHARPPPPPPPDEVCTTRPNRAGRNLFPAVPWPGVCSHPSLIASWTCLLMPDPALGRREPGWREGGNKAAPAPAEPVQPTVSHWESPGKHTITL